MIPERLPFDGLLLDMDGVLWKGNEFIEENINFVREWIDTGKEIRFLTNNSTRTRNYYREKLRRAKINVEKDKIITSAWGTSQWLKKKGIKEVFVIGEEGLIKEIEDQEIRTINDPETVLTGHKIPQAVVIGMDRSFTYRKLWAGLLVIDKGGLFVVTNEDATFPLPDGRAPGGGSLASALKTASGKKPDVVIGKPHSPLFEYAMNNLKIPKMRVLMVGDRLETDILGAKRMGLVSLLLFTGITSKEDIRESSIKPDHVAKDLIEFAETFEK